MRLHFLTRERIRADVRKQWCIAESCRSPRVALEPATEQEKSEGAVADRCPQCKGTVGEHRELPDFFSPDERVPSIDDPFVAAAWMHFHECPADQHGVLLPSEVEFLLTRERITDLGERAAYRALFRVINAERAEAQAEELANASKVTD